MPLIAFKKASARSSKPMPPNESVVPCWMDYPLFQSLKGFDDASHERGLPRARPPGDDEDFLERHFTDNDADPVSILEDRSVKEQLVLAIGMLPEREKLMMALYYEQDLNLREIGEVMGVTESRVCQLHTQAIARLRARIVGEIPAAAKKRKEKAGG